MSNLGSGQDDGDDCMAIALQKLAKVLSLAKSEAMRALCGGENSNHASTR